MNRRPRVGETGEISFEVSQQHIIDFSDAEMPAVLCTPWLVWFLEHSAREAMLPMLEADESTVGVHVDVSHLAPTPIGQSVTCVARIINVEGTLISFSLMASDELEEIARGTHKLRVISKARFGQRVSAKTTMGFQ